jgi:hypothetical protein
VGAVRAGQWEENDQAHACQLEGWVGRDRRSGEGNGFLEGDVAVLSKFWESVIGVAGMKFARHWPSVNWADGLHSETTQGSE